MLIDEALRARVGETKEARILTFESFNQFK